jgi:hypothetical protein
MATSPTTFSDVRFTDRDVVLVERRVRVTAGRRALPSISAYVVGYVPLRIGAPRAGR